MTVTFNAGTDFADVVDGLESVTLKYPGASSTVSVTSALRDIVDVMERGASGGRYTATDATWSLPTSEVTTRPPLGTKIIDSTSVYWTILEVSYAPQLNVYECTARALSIVAGLDTYITIQENRPVKSDGGAEANRWFEQVGGLHARIHEFTSTINTNQQSRYVERTFRITVADPVEITGLQRVLGPDGQTYEITGYEHSEDLADLPVILAKQTIWDEA